MSPSSAARWARRSRAAPAAAAAWRPAAAAPRPAAAAAPAARKTAALNAAVRCGHRGGSGGSWAPGAVNPFHGDFMVISW